MSAPSGPQRRDDGPRRSYDDGPRRSYDDGPRRSYDDGPRRGHDDGPRRGRDGEGRSDNVRDRLRARARKKARRQGRKKGFVRRKVCRFCADKNLTIDYRDPKTLRLFVTEVGKMIPRRISGNCARHQRQLAVAIKRARVLALLPHSGQVG